ncbi:MAG: hypothetical protein SNI12_08305 [Rikenellaceae bacterium]
MSVKVERLVEFEKDLKQLRKRYKTIDDDISVVERVITVEPTARPPFSFQIDNLGLETCVIKVRKIASRSFKGKGAMSGFRLIYAHFEQENRVVFIELYYKSSKEIEDRDRIKANFK